MQHLGTRVIETKHLIARPFRQDDVESVYRNWTSDSQVTPHLTWAVHDNEAVTKAYIDSCLESYSDLSSYRWGIELKASGQLIGDISVIDMNEKTLSAELGWVIGSAWWGQGYMTEIARAVIDFLIKEVGFNRVMAAHASQNTASGRVMEKIGMHYEGRLRQAGKTNQGIVDTIVYSKIKKDYTTF